MNELSKDVVREIELRGISPRPRWYFIARRSVFWITALLSTVAGAISLSVANYIFFDNGGVNPSVLIESPIEGIAQGAPILWLICFGLLVASAYVSVRHTRSGYRYRTITITAGIVLATIILGVLMSSVDFGQAVEYYLVHHTSFYTALIRSNDDTKLPF